MEDYIYYLFTDGKRVVYFRSKSFLSKEEIKEIEERYKLRLKAQVSPVERIFKEVERTKS